jgi:tetratricopeptide (TPR) repeat protein
VLVILCGAVVLIGAAYRRERSAHADALAHAAAAERSRDEAVANFNRYEAVSGFLRTLLNGARAEVAHGKDTQLLRSIVDLAEKTLPDIDDNPAASGDAHMILAGVFRDLGEFARAETHLLAAVDRYTSFFGEMNRNTAAAMSNLGALYRGSLRRYGDAERLLVHASDILERIGGTDDIDYQHARSSLALLYLDRGDYSRAEPVLRAIRQAAEKRSGPDSLETLKATHNHAGALGELGRPHEALALERRVYEGRKRALGEDHPDTVNALLYMARLLNSLEQSAEALPMADEVIRYRLRDYGPSHQLTLSARGFHAIVLRDLGRLDEALAEIDSVHAAYAAHLGPEHFDTIEAQLLSVEFRIAADPSPARLADADACLATFEKAYPEGNYRVDMARSLRGMALACAGRNEEAEATLLRAYRDITGRVSPANRISHRIADALVWFYTRAGRPAEAAAWRAKAAPPAE